MGVQIVVDDEEASGGKKFKQEEAKTAAKSTKSEEQPDEGKSKKSAGKTPSWMLTGKKAYEKLEEEEAKAEQARAESQRMFRFFVRPGEDIEITFLDGDLDEDGLLDVPMFYEHRVFANDSWRSFLCVDQDEPCPMCESGNRKSYVGAMTVINHTPYEIKNGPNKGKVLKDRRQLFVATRTVLRRLQKMAAKRGGLAGCRFEVSRESKTDPRVGSMFEFLEKTKMSEIKAKHGEEAVPANYEEELAYYTAEELKKMGVHSGNKTIGGDEEDSDAAEQL